MHRAVSLSPKMTANANWTCAKEIFGAGKWQILILQLKQFISELCGERCDPSPRIRHPFSLQNRAEAEYKQYMVLSPWEIHWMLLIRNCYLVFFIFVMISCPSSL